MNKMSALLEYICMCQADNQGYKILCSVAIQLETQCLIKYFTQVFLLIQLL